MAWLGLRTSNGNELAIDIAFYCARMKHKRSTDMNMRWSFDLIVAIIVLTPFYCACAAAETNELSLELKQQRQQQEFWSTLGRAHAGTPAFNYLLDPTTVKSTRTMTPEAEARIRAFIRAHDKNGNGRIDISELPHSNIRAALETNSPSALGAPLQRGAQGPIVESKPPPLAKSAGGSATDRDRVSPAVRDILSGETRSKVPTREQLHKLQRSDTRALLDDYRIQDSTNKLASMWALAYLGGDDACNEFRRTLEADYGMRNLELGEFYTLVAVAAGLGIASSENDSAFAFLCSHVTPDSWREICTWRLPSAGDDMCGRLAEWTLAAIGLSGRAEALSILESSLASTPEELKRIGSGVLDGLFWLEMSKTHDRQQLIELFINSDESVNKVHSWLQNEGKRYRETMGAKGYPY